MADGSELRSIAWSEAFPFVRLFRTFSLALNANRLVLALLCVIVIYVGGRLFDAAWVRLGGGVPQATGAGGVVLSAVDAYAGGTQAEYAAWQDGASEARAKTAAAALVAGGKAGNTAEAQKLLGDQSLESLLLTDEHRKEVKEALAWIDKRVQEKQKAIEEWKPESDQEKARHAARQKARRAAVVTAADTLRIALHAQSVSPDAISRRNEALNELLSDDVNPIEPAKKEAVPKVVGKAGDDRSRLNRLLETRARLAEYQAVAPRGPFISLLDFETRCFAGAVQGVCAGRFGFTGGALSPEPALAGSLAAALRGVAWTVIHRPCFAVLYGLFHFAVFALFGGAICRSAALQAARDQQIGIGEALRFAKDKFSGLLLAPLMPVGVFAVVALVLAAAGLVGAIPAVGEMLAGALYFLALLGGFVLAVVFLATVLGFHLMWPTIAVEASEAFDAVTRAYQYVTSRIWHVAFYSFLLLVHGALGFVLARLVMALTLKLAHTFTGWCMNWDGAGQLEGVGKLNAMWSMPAWADLPILPSTGPTPFWGNLFASPLSATEWIGAALLAIWVFLLVAALGAFAVSYFFCGSTQMYFLLRRQIDATDYEEVYYEEPADDLMLATAASAAPVEGDTAAPAAPAEPPPSA